jgi:hypothetical protein
MNTNIQLMKTLNLIALLVSLSLSSMAQSYNIYIAKSNGEWSNSTTWNVSSRPDNVKMDKYIIPAVYTVTADKNSDYLALGDIEVIVSGTLKMGGSALMELTNNSTIQLLPGGDIDGNGGSQEILIGGVVKYVGNINKLIAGPLFADRTTTGFSAFTTLAVHFISFTAAKNNDNNITLKWSTSQEINNSHFEIEYSSNGRDWSPIGTVYAVAVNNAINNYSFTHKSNVSLASYRLKQVDKDGKFEYSSVAVVRNNNASTDIFASNKNLTISSSSANISIQVMNMNGQVVFSQLNLAGKSTVNVNSLHAGTYVVAISSNNNIQAVKKVMIF